jgi:hypothetical protein
MAMTQEQYTKIQQYLLSNGQQELVGHLDGIWQELNQLRADASVTNDIQNAQQFQDNAKQADAAGNTPEPQPTEEDGTPIPTPDNPTADDGTPPQGSKADTTLTEGEIPAPTEQK